MIVGYSNQQLVEICLSRKTGSAGNSNLLLDMRRSLEATTHVEKELVRFIGLGTESDLAVFCGTTKSVVDAFAGMEELYSIDLSDNELSEIDIDVFRKINAKMWGESLYYGYMGREWCAEGYINLQRNKFNASMKLAVLEYFVHEHDFVWVGDDMPAFGNCYSSREDSMSMPSGRNMVMHKTGTFRVSV